MLTLNPTQLLQFLRTCIQHKEPVLITGDPGIGKSEIAEEATHLESADWILSHPVIEGPEDSKGLPFANHEAKYAEWLPYGDLMRLVNADRTTVYMMDDFDHASEAVQKAKMQLLLARQIGPHKVSPHVVFIGATNFRKRGMGVSGILEPVKSRFTIVSLQTNYECFERYAIAKKVNPYIVGYLKNHPDKLSREETTADMVNTPCPRNWVAAGRQLDIQAPELRMHAVAGRVGEGEAAGLMGFIEMVEKAPDPEEILAHPKSAPLPRGEDVGVCYAVSLALSYRTTLKTFPAISEYAKRMYDARDGMAEYAVLIIRDAARKCPEIIEKSPAFAALLSHPLGKNTLEIGKSL